MLFQHHVSLTIKVKIEPETLDMLYVLRFIIVIGYSNIHLSYTHTLSGHKISTDVNMTNRCYEDRSLSSEVVV